MKYQDPKFTLPSGPVKQMPGTCDACVWGRGEHTAACACRSLDESDRIICLSFHEEQSSLPEGVWRSRQTLDPPGCVIHIWSAEGGR